MACSLVLLACSPKPVGREPAFGGIEGRVFAESPCGAASPCASPIPADLRVMGRTGTLVAHGSSGVDGRYRLELLPGRYTVVAKTADQPGILSAPVAVRVVGTRFTHLDIRVDDRGP